MKILVISAFPPNQKTAGQDYTRRLIIDLLEKGHSVSLIYAKYPGHVAELPDSVQVLRVIQPSLKNCLAKPNFHPFFTRRFDRNTLSLIKSVCAGYDMLYFDFSQVHLYSLFVEHPCKILMCHDVIAQKFSRKGRWQLPWILRSEGKILRAAQKIITFSRKDCDFIRRAYGMDSVAVNFYLKNGHFAYDDMQPVKNQFCLYGAWNRAENAECLEWFLQAVYPNVRPDLQFVVIGGGMAEALQKKLCALKNISYLGFVEHPVREIAICQALIAPLRKGAGVKVKVIDALSCGTRVIGTEVAFEGIEDNAEKPLFVRCDSAEDFAVALNSWGAVSVAEKQCAADEFFARYNTNHFADLLESGAF